LQEFAVGGHINVALAVDVDPDIAAADQTE
jgi:hypothetical protein